MSEYEAQDFYRVDANAASYNDQYEAPLAPSNLRAKLVGWAETAAFHRMLKRAPKGGRALDIACGTGRYTEQLLKHGYKVGALDFSMQMMSFARKRVADHPNMLFFQNADAEHLPFKDKQFDLVNCMRLYHRIPRSSRLEMMREVKRVGRGQAILFFGMTSSWLKMRQAIRSSLGPKRPSNPYPVTMAELRHDLEEVGLNMKASAWVLPVLVGALVVLVDW